MMLFRKNRIFPILITLLAASCGGTEEPSPPDAQIPLGGLTVRWSIENDAGDVLSCEDVDTDTVDVAIGGSPVTLDCNAGTTTFESLLPQRYPVVVQLKFGPVVLATGLGNADVVAGETVEIDIVLQAERRNNDVGSIYLKWRIDDQPPARRCGELEALTLRITAEPSSIDPTLSADVACTDGEITILNAKPGSYNLRLTLERPDGSKVVSLLTGNFRVVSAGTADLGLLNFTTVLTGGGKILAQYTISSSVATTEICEQIGAMEVRMSIRSIDIQTQSTRLEGTETSSCAKGSLSREKLRTNLYSVQLELMDGFGIILTSSTVRDVPVTFGQTSTVSIDLVPER